MQEPGSTDASVAWRDEVARYLRGLFVLGLVVTAATVMSQVWAGQGSWALVALLAVQVVAAAAIVALRRRARATALVALVALIAIDVATLAHFGPVQGAGMLVALVLVISVLYAGVRVGAALLALSLVVSLGAGALFSAGESPPIIDTGSMATWVRSAGVTTFLGGFVLATIGFVVDAFERALAQAQAAREAEAHARQEAERTALALTRARELEAMGRLAGGVAHDFNNALTILLAHSEELLERDLPADVRERIRSIDQAAHAAAATTRQLLVFSRGVSLRPGTCDPAAALGEGLKSLRRLLPDNVALELEGASAAHVPLQAADLMQVVLNLVLNARDACVDGGTVRVLVGQADDHVTIDVVDDGIGMDAATRDRLFEPFFTTKGSEGTGLGMPMVHGVVTRVGGRIEVESEPGRGTRIRLVLPAVPASPEAAVAARQPLPLSGRTVFVVEDEPEIQDIARGSLAAAGARVVLAASVAEALRVLDRPEPIDLMCTDGVLQDGTALAVLDRFRERFPAAPVLLCSGHVPEDLESRGLLPRGRDRLPKPFTGGDLVRAVSRLLA